MEKVLRGHHLLCVHGFRGMGYSPSFVEVMTEIVTDIRDDNKDFPIKVVASFDHACGACPHRGETICEAGPDSQEHVMSMDIKAINHIGLKKDETYMKSELVRLTAERVKPEDLDFICAGCSWLTYGVCKEGIEMINKKTQLQKNI